MLSQRLQGFCAHAFGCCANIINYLKYSSPAMESREYRSEQRADDWTTLRTIKMAAYKVGEDRYKVARIVDCHQSNGYEDKHRTHYSFLNQRMGGAQIMDKREALAAFTEFEHDMDRCCRTPAHHDCRTRYFECGPQGVGAV